MAALALALGLSACSAGPGSVEPTDADDPASAESPSAPAQRQAPPISDPLPAMPMTCDADKAKADAIGRPATEANIERARLASGAESVRVIPPGTMVTLEFVESRLNIDVDAENIIIDLRCG
ncbi:I78 family peptidase inhibitor [Marilutibacter chinensis]|uniref:Elastase inhibitor AFLEI Flags n=1 Tax=Marilutibacter chinensis TaxID=2912247 RepID=A0ABS9HZ84_9GAMM|nr:I78 family peptidase inhibitor [Lysobacter chinensis]MCF7223692.1 Elastase inhibitor AFLEI Flags: Precursor [Lysobacter chinensis]